MTASSPLPALPFDGGATLPKVQRYTDQRFRALARGGVHKARDEHLLQAVALLRLVPPAFARHIFHWSKRGLDKALGQAEIWDRSQTLQEMHEANLRALRPGHAVGLVDAARDGGWVKTNREPLPDIVKLAMRGFRDEGLTVAQIAEVFQLPYWTVSYGFRVPHRDRMAKDQSIGLVL